MKKFLKTVAGLGALAAFVGGAYYAYKKYVEDESTDDFDEEEFDLFDSDDTDRSYVTLDMDGSEKKEESSDDTEKPLE